MCLCVCLFVSVCVRVCVCVCTLIQCLHHLSLMRFQESGRVSKAFAMKLSNLNDFIKPAKMYSEDLVSRGSSEQSLGYS